jgi:hypothetical protein
VVVFVVFVCLLENVGAGTDTRSTG